MRAALLVAGLALALLAYGCVHRHGGQSPRAELEAARSDVQGLQERAKAVDQSVENSRDTATRIDVAGAQMRQHATQARDRILERIQVEPVPVGSSSPDPIVMHEVRQAYTAAIRAACRVQRTDDCAAPAAATD